MNRRCHSPPEESPPEKSRRRMTTKNPERGDDYLRPVGRVDAKDALALVQDSTSFDLRGLRLVGVFLHSLHFRVNQRHPIETRLKHRHHFKVILRGYK